MSSAARSTTFSRFVALMVLAPLALGVWFGAPFVLPVWRWLHVDFKAIAEKNNLPEAEVRTEFHLVVHYNPRISGTAEDPSPWQIVESTPTWHSLDPLNLKEDSPPLLVRCTLVNDEDGGGMSPLWIPNGTDERYFRITAWRLPGGTFGRNSKRPVILYQGLSRQNCGISYGVVENGRIANWENDDLYRNRNDGFGQ